MKKLLFLMATLVTGTSQGELVEKTVEYQRGDTVFEGFQVHDDAVLGRRPSVLIIHQWFGVSDYEKFRARELARLGYNVFAADIYGKGIRPADREAAKAEAAKYKGDRTLYRERLSFGLEELKKHELTDPAKIAAIGYCFGGTGAIELARSGADIAGIVSFHGNLNAGPSTVAESGKVKAKLLILHGAIDPVVPPEQVADFEKEMNAAQVDWQLVAYSGAVHSFTQKKAGNDPSTGSAYHPTADARSWKAMRAFFDEIFRAEAAL